jgi:hypothetical protein
MSKPVITVFLVAAAVVVIASQSLALFGGRAPSLISPASFPLIVPALLGVPPWLVTIFWGGVFLGWNPALLKSGAHVPARTVALWLATALLSGAYFVASWRAGLVFEGPVFTRVSFVLDLALFGLCSVLLWRARVAPSFRRSLSFQACLFVWLLTYAFPYLGQAP